MNTVLETGKKPQGRVLMHEHIQVTSHDLLHTFGGDWLDREKLIDFASEILTRLRTEHGVGVFVDGTPIDLGRDVSLLQEVSRRSGVDIVASSGLYYFPSCYTGGRSAAEIAGWFIREWERGMEGTGAKPGILKCAAQDVLTEDSQKRLQALAIAQRETGLPVYIHSNHIGELGLRQLETMLEISQQPEKLLVGHCVPRPEYDYWKKLLDYGCCLVIDQHHCTDRWEEAGQAIRRLWENGYGDRLTLGNDLCVYSDFGCSAYTGLELSAEEQVTSFFHSLDKTFACFAEAGGTAAQWEQMLTENAYRVF